MTDDELKSTEGVWCVVANIKRERPFGEGGIETKSGTKQFRGGTKVYIGGCYAGACDGVVCIGLHRKSRKFITCVIKVTHIENFRAKVAYHPEVVRRLKEDERCWFQTQEDAENWAVAFPGWQEIWRPSKNSNAGGTLSYLPPSRYNLVMLCMPFVLPAVVVFLGGCAICRAFGIRIRKDDVVNEDGRIELAKPEYVSVAKHPKTGYCRDCASEVSVHVPRVLEILQRGNR